MIKMEWWQWFGIAVLAGLLVVSLSGCIAQQTRLPVRQSVPGSNSILYVPAGTMIGEFKTEIPGIYLDGRIADSVYNRLMKYEELKGRLPLDAL